LYRWVLNPHGPQPAKEKALAFDLFAVARDGGIRTIFAIELVATSEAKIGGQKILM
jgi:hypothetical protein